MATEQQMTNSVPGRYASALFDLAQEQSQLPQTEADIDKLQAMLDDSEDLRRMLKSPVFSAEDQTKAMEAISKQAGLSPLTTNFIKLVIKNRRLFALPEIIKSFRVFTVNARGEVQAEVTSATPLSDDQINALQQTLMSSIGKNVQVSTQVNPSLLGGLVVKIGSRMIDSSLRTKLSTLKMRMKEVG